MFVQKVGGIYFLKLGRMRLIFCLARKPAKVKPLPTWHCAPFYLDPRRHYG